MKITTMSLSRLLHAISTGVATFGLSPSLPAAPASVASLRKTASEALAGDAIKLKCDFQAAYGTLAVEVESSGQSLKAEA
jgi:hypothetical protein